MFFKALDLDMEGDMLIRDLGNKELKLEEIEQLLTSQTFYQMQQNRHYVGLTLQEAEHLRGSMHLLKEDWSEGGNPGLALRALGNLESIIGDSLLDSFGPVISSAKQKYQLSTSEQLLRFANNAHGFQLREMNILLRSLQHTNIAHRKPWWIDVRSCRRRAQTPWEQLPVAKVFIQADEFDDLATKAMLSRLRWSFAAQRLWPEGAFKLLDTDKNGSLSKGEVKSGLQWLGLNKNGDDPCWLQQIDALFVFLDKDHNGVVDLEEFKAGLELEQIDWESVPSAVPIDGQPDAPGPDLSSDGMESAKDIYLTDDMCQKLGSGRFKVRWVGHGVFTSVWNTDGTLAERPMAIWEPNVQTSSSMFGATDVKKRIALGCYATIGFAAPSSVPCLEVFDTDESGMFASHSRVHLDHWFQVFVPHPIRFREIWSQRGGASAEGGSKSLHIWEPIPPNETFVAMGMVATRSAAEPPVKCVRCVPRAWVAQVPESQVDRFWNDSGTGGAPACFWAPMARNSPARLFRVTSGTFTEQKPELFAMDRQEFYSRTVA